MSSLKRRRSHEDILKTPILTKFSSEYDLISLASETMITQASKSKVSKATELPEVFKKPKGILFNIIENEALSGSCQSLVHQNTPLTHDKRRSSMFSLFSVYNSDRVRRASGVSFISVKTINMYVKNHRRIFLYISITMAMCIVFFTLLLMFIF